MDNASKALIIAGSILITILVITVGIYIFQQGKNVPAVKITEDERAMINTFNAKFTRISNQKQYK